jgi:hypothetical protein
MPGGRLRIMDLGRHEQREQIDLILSIHVLVESKRFIMLWRSSHTICSEFIDFVAGSFYDGAPCRCQYRSRAPAPNPIALRQRHCR